MSSPDILILVACVVDFGQSHPIEIRGEIRDYIMVQEKCVFPSIPAPPMALFATNASPAAAPSDILSNPTSDPHLALRK